MNGDALFQLGMDLDHGSSTAQTEEKLSRCLSPDGEGRKEALRRGIRITGLLGVIRDGGLRGHLDFEACLRKLRDTDFRLASEVETLVRQQYRDQSS